MSKEMNPIKYSKPLMCALERIVVTCRKLLKRGRAARAAVPL
jgi:hypothetical protein